MARRISTIEAGYVRAGRDVLPLLVRFDPRARRLTLRLVGNTVRVTCPGKRHFRDAVRLARDRDAWLAERLANRPTRIPFAIGETLPVLGAPRRIVSAARPGAAARLTAAEIVTGGTDEAAVARRVAQLMRREARAWLTDAANRHAATLGLPPCPVSVRDMRSRWGSCSAAPALSFSWRLVLAPTVVADYVAAHEVAHRRHMDHSPAFWSVVRQLCPDHRRYDAWLKAEGATLHAFG